MTLQENLYGTTGNSEMDSPTLLLLIFIVKDQECKSSVNAKVQLIEKHFRSKKKLVRDVLSLPVCRDAEGASAEGAPLAGGSLLCPEHHGGGQAAPDKGKKKTALTAGHVSTSSTDTQSLFVLR